MNIYLGCDHGAFDLKEKTKAFLQKRAGVEVIDCGTHVSERCNYPEFATKVCEKVQKREGIGILLCGSGTGMSIAANRYAGIRAALCRTAEEAKLSRAHNDSNILCLGARITTWELAEGIIETWLATEFEGGRHVERIELFDQLGEKF
jgi:ribose 5-phosphate isomerase B